MPTDHVDSLTPQGRAVNTETRAEDRVRSGGSATRAAQRPDMDAESSLKGPPDADVGAPAQPPGDESARMVKARIAPPAQQGEGHDERGDYGRTDPRSDAPEAYGKS
ncbi:MAG TPA: hypothetical protein VN042_06105 [Asticcacaulis sp.]|nr:hypothetical protein [Asticcacaulis sp.]